jgi:hypothetical protein
MLVDRIDLAFAEIDEQHDWSIQRDRLRAELSTLWERWKSFRKGRWRRGGSDQFEKLFWALTRTMSSLGVLLMEHGNDDEFGDGLELLLDRAEMESEAITDVEGWLSGLLPIAAVLDRPAIDLPESCHAILVAAEAAARSTGQAADRAVVNFLWAVYHVKREELQRGLDHALRALADAAVLFARTRSVRMRRSQMAELGQYQHVALTAAMRLGDARLVAELIEAARPQALPAAGGDPASGDAPLGDAIYVTVEASSSLRTTAEQLGHREQRSLALEDAIVAVGGWDAWWWGSWFAMSEYFWAIRSPTGTWTCGHRVLDEQARDALILIADIYHRDGPSPERAELPLSYEDELETSRRLAETFLPQPLSDALDDPEAGTMSSVVVAGPLSGMIPLPTLAVHTREDVRMIERAVLRVQPPAVLVEVAQANTANPFGPWPLAVACLDPVGDLPYARHNDLIAPHMLVAAKLIEDRSLPSKVATAETLRTALTCAGRSDNALFFYSGHVSPGEISGDLATHLVLGRDRVTAADFYGVGVSEPFCAPARVMLSACDSGGTAGSGSGEWFGLSGGLFVAGARHVIATAWPILDSAFGNAFDCRLIAQLETMPDAGRALQELQVEALEQWRSSGSGNLHPAWLPTPAIFASYQSIGLLS